MKPETLVYYLLFIIEIRLKVNIGRSAVRQLKLKVEGIIF